MAPSTHRVPKNLIVLLAFLLIAVALPSAGARFSASSAATVPDPKSPFGVAGVMRWPDWGSFDRPATAMLDTGGSWVREDFAWGLIEPHDSVYDWNATDRIVNAARQRGLNILGIISYGTSWASPTKADDGGSTIMSFYPPDNGKYYAFVRALVDHYKSTVHYWEVWNEPN